MSEPKWISRELALMIHGEQLAIFGGAPGLRDAGLLESALDRPRNKWAYGVEELPELAGAYAFGLARNHPFIDGNKRAAFACMMVFLRWNGIQFRPSPLEATAAIMALAAGEVDEDGLVRWLQDRLAAQG
ncbi:type II toxin-antitoxin system death-on-curing family toxin [Oryzibacter oryziterrae]|uniref:type II toxin-antitoxin system death-on-curing family toxin n=1 Tax=Oryzibacter oryziterrae TaxID=2766474 RepID=UPI001F0236E7|nr:type II toxin-antitoxin system death-on-curing family toxin [Oryzibacter oryziterrae]